MIAESGRVSDRKSELPGVSGWQFEDRARCTRSSENTPWRTLLDDGHDRKVPVEKYDIDGAPHEPGVDGAAIGNEEKEIGARSFPEQPDGLTDDR